MGNIYVKKRLDMKNSLLIAIVSALISMLCSPCSGANNEFRGAWLSTVESIDWPKVKILLGKIEKEDGTLESERERKERIARQRDSQQLQLQNLLYGLKKAGCNNVMFQVVSNSDALYPSKILQWAPTLTDTPGTAPGYDPLALAVKTAHSLGMKIHAWINPLRIGKVEMARRSDNICYTKKHLVQQHKGKLYWDPGQPEVRQYLKELVTEILTNYDVDGIHIDDYFYPSGLRGSGKQAEKKGRQKVWNDEHLYKKYGSGKSLDEWREGNINAVVRELYNAVKAARPDALFGVSPAGRLVNTRNLYADPVQWAQEGTIDYLIPQIYWPHGHKIADFKKVLDSWNGLLKDVPVIIGLAAYRFGQQGFESLDEYLLQVQECRTAPYNVIGHCWFTTHDIITEQFTEYLLNNIYQSDEIVKKPKP